MGEGGWSRSSEVPVNALVILPFRETVRIPSKSRHRVHEGHDSGTLPKATRVLANLPGLIKQLLIFTVVQPSLPEPSGLYGEDHLWASVLGVEVELELLPDFAEGLSRYVMQLATPKYSRKERTLVNRRDNPMR
eukprot:6492421-Amphidinium_carterae.1